MIDLITVLVRLDLHAAIVRKAVVHEDGMIDYKAALGKDGEWVVVPEGEKYPKECYHFPIVDQAPMQEHYIKTATDKRANITFDLHSFEIEAGDQASDPVMSGELRATLSTGRTATCSFELQLIPREQQRLQATIEQLLRLISEV